jgi:hypothetical protein
MDVDRFASNGWLHVRNVPLRPEQKDSGSKCLVSTTW